MLERNIVHQKEVPQLRDVSSELYPNTLDAMRRQKSLEIVQSIVHEGILTPAQVAKRGRQPLFSSDYASPIESRTLIYGRGVNKRTIDAALLQDSSFSVLPVVAERQRESLLESWNTSYEELEERVNSSILVVMPYSSLTRKVGGPAGSWTTAFRTEEDVVSEDFSAVLIPEKVHGEVQEVLQDAPVPVVVVGYTKGQVRNKICRIPDYKSALERIFSSQEIGKKEDLFIHGVRLPTVEDMKR